MRNGTRWAGAGMVLLLAGAAAQAAIVLVPVGNPGNPADITGLPNPCGAVAYEYRIGQYEVTAGQYRDFLNAVDPTGANALGLYAANMDTSGFGCQITRHVGSLYDFSGRPSGTEADWTERPVNYVAWTDAARFCNWLTTGNTESGVYNTTSWTALDHQVAAATYGTAYFLPTESEWYKAAYYSGSGSVYYDYPTASNAAPGRDLSEATNPGNNANYFNGSYLLPTYYRTNVGEFELSDSPYGTFDQGGNVWEWTETPYDAAHRVYRGSSFFGNATALRADSRNWGAPADESDNVGFRVAAIVTAVPEPGALALLALGTLAALGRRRR